MVEVRSLGAEMEAGQASDQVPFPPSAVGARSSRGVVGLAVVLVLFLAAAAAVNPLREAPYDDDWAFGETVKHLLETGQYRLNDWLAPNMPFQAVWVPCSACPADIRLPRCGSRQSCWR